MEWIKDNPVIVGTVIKSVLALATVVGLETTEADREAVVAAVIAVAVAIIALTGKERASVTPMNKVERLAHETGGNAIKLVDKLKGLIPLADDQNNK